MIKTFIFIIFFLGCCITCPGQADSATPPEIIILKQQLSNAVNDTSRILIMADLGYVYAYLNSDSSFLYGQQALKKSDEINFQRGRANALAGLGNMYLRVDDYAKGLEYQLKAMQVSEQYGFEREKAISYIELAYTYDALSDTSKALAYYKRSRDIYNKIPFDVFKKVESGMGLAQLYMKIGRNDSALAILQNLYNDPGNPAMRQAILQIMGDLYTKLQDYPTALKCLYDAISLDLKGNDLFSLAWAFNSAATLYKNIHQADSCIFYAKKKSFYRREAEFKSTPGIQQPDAVRAI
ncbi:MAG: tetratricopeptide repeat protein [Bacteroidota bacterium]